MIYVWSDALPDDLTDEIVPGVVSKVTTTKEEIAQDVCREGRVTTRGVVERLDISRKHAWEVLSELKDQGVVKVVQNPDDGRVNDYEYISGTIRRSVDLGL